MTVPGGKAGEPPRLPGGLASRRAATGVPASTTDVGTTSSDQASVAPGMRQRRRGSRPAARYNLYQHHLCNWPHLRWSQHRKNR